MNELIELHQKYEFNTYAKRDLMIVKGKHAKVWSDTGEEYIDCVAGIGVANVGHCNEYVAEAIKKQVDTLITCPNIFYNDARARALGKLGEVAPEGLTRAFLANSGTEAMEAAMKFARFVTGKNDFIATVKAFHGRSMGALTATFKPEYKEGFGPLLECVTHVPFNNIEKMAEAVTENTAAIMLELVQGEGGINIAQKEYVQQVRQLCDDKNILLIIDEIQTGFCRTGKMFAIEHYGIKADMMTVAKGIAGGYPVGVLYCSDKIEIPLGKHGTTFGGNPLGCAAVEASIQYMQDNELWKQAEEKGKYFAEKLGAAELSKVREIRNLGLMIGIECKEKVKPYLEELMAEKVLALPAGPLVIRMLPPLTITFEELDLVVEKLVKVLK